MKTTPSAWFRFAFTPRSRARTPGEGLRRRWSAAAGLACALVGGGAERSPAADGQPSLQDAKSLLLAVAEKERGIAGQFLKFRAQITGPDGDEVPGYEGRLWMGTEGRFRLEYPGGTLVSDGATFWEYHPRNRQVLLRSAGEPGDRLLPGQIFTRFLGAEPLEASRRGDTWSIRLNPESFGNLAGLTVELQARQREVLAVVTLDPAGTRAAYRVVERKPGLPAAEKFTFTPPPGTETVDMR